MFVTLALGAAAHAATTDGGIDAARRVTWVPGTDVGVPGGSAQYRPGGASQRTTLIDVTQSPYSADSTGATNAATAIQSAINAATSGQVVYLPAGTYRINNELQIAKDNITFRGAGPNSTIIDWRGTGGACIRVGGDIDWPYTLDGTTITSGGTRGSTSVTVSDGSAFTVGGMVRLSEAPNATLPTLHVSDASARTRAQLSRVTAKSGNTLTIFPALMWTLGSTPQARAIGAGKQLVGIESLRIDGTNASAPQGINMECVQYCWSYDVHVRKVPNYPFYYSMGIRNELVHCFADGLQNSGPNGAGLLIERNTGTLVENNIFKDQFPHIEVNFQTTGSAFLYNFCVGNVVDGLVGMSINANHGPHNAFNLYEGNVSAKFQSDGYFGSASDDTVFRNWFHASDPTTQDFLIGIYLNRFSRNYNLVGNILGAHGNTYTLSNSGTNGSYGTKYIYVFGLPNIGNLGSSGGTAQLSLGDPWASWGTGPGPDGFQEIDLDVAATTLLKGNYNKSTNSIPAGESLSGDTLHNSLAYSAKPDWFGNLTWPAFDASTADATNTTYNNTNISRIPAGYRYVNGVDPSADTPSATSGPSSLLLFGP